VRTLDFGRHALSFCAAAALLAGCGSQTVNTVPTVNNAGKSVRHSKTFYYTGGEQRFIVPAGVEKLTVIAVGARGGAFEDRDALGGGRIWAIIPVTPGEKLAIFVGGQGSENAGGFNGGGNGGSERGDFAGYGGGGASDVREGGEQMTDRILVAGGAGGAGGLQKDGGTGGKGGGSIGGSGAPGSGASSGFGGAGGGSGGTQDSGGDGGSGGSGVYGDGNPGTSGTLGDGGAGGAGCSYYPYCSYGGAGGGGGGGYYGGGGGGTGGGGFSYYGSGGGGGGGSSYIEPSAYAYRSWQGWKIKTSNGLVVFDW
jgi:hypothetical protein